MYCLTLRTWIRRLGREKEAIQQLNKKRDILGGVDDGCLTDILVAAVAVAAVAVAADDDKEGKGEVLKA